jgi:hypothetical protein
MVYAGQMRSTMGFFAPILPQNRILIRASWP